MKTAGGIDIYGGTVTMEAGTIITGNTSGSTSSGSLAGGVYVSSSGTFIMNGGSITNNTANCMGWSYENGSSCPVNDALLNTAAGGVYVVSGGTFTQNGGTVTGNFAGDITETATQGSPVLAPDKNIYREP
jgi:hypothetical protein